jgi:hypothetical protein
VPWPAFSAENIPLPSPGTRRNMSAWQMRPEWSTERIRAPSMRPAASRRIRVEVGVAKERPSTSEGVLAQRAEEAGLDLLSWTIRIIQGDRIWGTAMKTARGA